jgi:hypothetical protein
MRDAESRLLASSQRFCSECDFNVVSKAINPLILEQIRNDVATKRLSTTLRVVVAQTQQFGCSDTEASTRNAPHQGRMSYNVSISMRATAKRNSCRYRSSAKRIKIAQRYRKVRIADDNDGANALKDTDSRGAPLLCWID